MKKISIVISAIVVFAFSIGSVQAGAPGVRDLSPGSEFVCYFLVSKARVDTGAGPSTLYRISEVKGQGAGTITSPWSNLWYNFYTIDSVWVYDYGKRITRWATHLQDIGKIIEGMGDDVKASLSVTFEGAPYYAGYILVNEVQYPAVDNIIADVYQLNLSEGIAASSSIPVRQYAVGLPSQITSVRTDNSAAGAPSAKGYERWTGNALACATNRIWGLTSDYGASWFTLYPRYLINESSGKTYWIIWRSSIKNASTGASLEEVDMHVYAINGAEDYRSTGIQLREMSILDAGKSIPSSLKVSYPYIGLINLASPYTDMELLGWNWELANNGETAAAINWAGMSLMAVDAGTTGTGYYPSH